MKALAISDTHFGAWSGEPLLRHQFALDALAAHLDGVDELILLGDLFDLLFARVEHAFAQADPLFSLIQEKLQGKRVVFLAGNHDHHIVVRFLRSAVEMKIATGAMGEALSQVYCSEHKSFFQSFLDRRLDGIHSEIVYPLHRVGDVVLSHGHYLDAHLENSLGNRLLSHSAWRVAGGRPEMALAVEDYEAVIVPLTELLFTVAQMPRGTAAQQSFYAQLLRLGRLLALPNAARKAICQLRDRAAARRGSNAVPDDRAIRAACDAIAQPRRDPMAHAMGIRACDPAAAPLLALEAYARVARNLDWVQGAKAMVFAHTHQPLDGVPDASGTMRFWNTGSWMYDPPERSSDTYRAYLERAWPGTGVLIDTERESPQLVEMLADYNPLGR